MFIYSSSTSSSIFSSESYFPQNEQFKKFSEPIVMLKLVPKFWSEKQFQKQPFPMDVIEFGMVSDNNDEHPEKQ
jgi:hypothetical protein